MDTLYIDVYFLINFTVDILSLYFAGLFSRVRTTPARIVSCATVGALFACGAALFDFSTYIYIPMLLLSAMLITVLFSKKVGFLRRFKLLCAFLIFETFIGGAVGYAYGLLDKFLYPKLTEDSGAENRELLLLSITVLLSFGVIKLFFYVFRGTPTDENVNFTVSLMGKTQSFDALVDSGNLLLDPLTSSPIILIKRRAFDLLSKDADILGSDIDEIRRRVRIIPAKGLGNQKMLQGLRVDFVSLEKREEKIYNAIIAFDDEEGDYGGYSALMPKTLVDI